MSLLLLLERVENRCVGLFPIACGEILWAFSSAVFVVTATQLQFSSPHFENPNPSNRETIWAFPNPIELFCSWIDTKLAALDVQLSVHDMFHHE